MDTVEEKEKIIRVCHDVVFKMIFQKEKEILIKMICDITGIKKKISAEEVITGYELEPYILKGKVNKSDMLVKLGKDYFLNIEVNYRHEKNVMSRNMIQLFRICTQIVESGMSDKEVSLKMVGQLNLNTFHNKNGKIIERGIYTDLDTKEELDYGVIKLWNLNIENCFKMVYNEDTDIKELPKMVRWGAILYSEIKNIKDIEKIIGDDLLTMEEKEKLIIKLKDINDDNRIIQEWMVEENNRLREEGQLAYARDEGREEGIQEGLKKGIQDNQKEVITNMLAKGFDYETISEITKKEIEEIKEIEKTLDKK